ncbi:MAG: alpha/beta fold hydrolase [Vulcanimicrobiaceae bacterium]
MIATLWTQTSDTVLTGARCAGSTGEPIVFVHGVGSTAAIWDYQLRAFQHTHQAMAIELRGNGAAKPEPPPQSITREGFLEDVLAVVAATRHPKFHFVGCSLGGVVGFELWKRAPERVLSYTFVGSFAAYPNAQAYADGIRDAVLAAGDMRTFAEQRAAKMGLPPERLTETLEQMSCKSVPSYLASTQATWTGDYRDILGSITVPTLVIVGDRDQIAPLPLSQEIASGIPGARLEILPNAGHVTNADAAQAFNALLSDFLHSP